MYYSVSMSSASSETVSSNENWKKGGGKTKRGKPTGRREVIEKYKAIGFDSLHHPNPKQARIRRSVRAYEPPKCLLCARLRRRAIWVPWIVRQDHLLSVEDGPFQEEVEAEAREQVRKMWRQKWHEWERELAEKYVSEDPEYPDTEWGIEDTDWLGINYGDLQDEFYDRLFELWDHSTAEEKRSYQGLDHLTWLAAPHSGGKHCRVCEQLVKYGADAACQ